MRDGSLMSSRCWLPRVALGHVMQCSSYCCYSNSFGTLMR